MLHCHVDYKSLQFNDQLQVKYKASAEGPRLVFDYEFWTKSIDKPLAFGKTVHAALMSKGEGGQIARKAYTVS